MGRWHTDKSKKEKYNTQKVMDELDQHPQPLTVSFLRNPMGIECVDTTAEKLKTLGWRAESIDGKVVVNVFDKAYKAPLEDDLKLLGYSGKYEMRIIGGKRDAEKAH